MSGTARITFTRTSGVYVICRRIAQLIGQNKPLDIFFQKPLYLAPVTSIFRTDQRDGFAAVLRTRRAAYAMDIILRIVRHVIVYYQRHVRHVYSARHDIRCHQHIDLAVAESQHDLVPLVLLQVAVHGARVNT